MPRLVADGGLDERRLSAVSISPSLLHLQLDSKQKVFSFCTQELFSFLTNSTWPAHLFVEGHHSSSLNHLFHRARRLQTPKVIPEYRHSDYETEIWPATLQQGQEPQVLSTLPCQDSVRLAPCMPPCSLDHLHLMLAQATDGLLSSSALLCGSLRLHVFAYQQQQQQLIRGCRFFIMYRARQDGSHLLVGAPLDLQRTPMFLGSHCLGSCRALTLGTTAMATVTPTTTTRLSREEIIVSFQCHRILYYPQRESLSTRYLCFRFASQSRLMLLLF